MKLAVIGTGVIGRLRAATVVEHPEANLVGVADIDRVSAVEVASRHRVKAFVDYREMIDTLAPDGVIVSSPVTLHEEMCRHAFERGCHVLVEKPLANSVDSCRKILQTAERAGCTLAVGFNHRFYPAVRYLKRVLADSRIGEMDHVRVFGGHEGLNNFRADWMYQGKLSGGGCMMDIGIHMTDLARFVAGEVTEVYGVASGRIWNVPESEDNAMAIMKTARNVPIIYQATWTEWRGFRWRIDVYGSRGMVRAGYAPMFNLLVTQDQPGGKRKKSTRLYPELILREKLKGWQSTTKQTFELELRDFLRMTRGDSTVDLADGWSGVRANEIAQAVYRSGVEGCAIRLAGRDTLRTVDSTKGGSTANAPI
jgi:predicted dehydrogenase